MEKNKIIKLLYRSNLVIVLFIIQLFASKAGGAVANLVSYERIDYYNLFTWISIHHIVQMFIALIIIVAMKKILKCDFGFKLGDKKKGVKYIKVFTIVITVYILISYLIGYTYNKITPYDFPLNARNIIGTLGFQLFLSGTAEEILFRALPITLLTFVFKGSIKIKWSITLEIIIAALLFAIAHIQWSLCPFVISMNYFQLFYAFVLGITYGIAYQRSDSIVYPALMHSISNVLMVGIGYLFAVLY